MIPFRRLFKPGLSVQVGTALVTNIPLPEVATRSGLRVQFRVERSLTQTPDSAQITIWNLSPERRTAISSAFSELGVSAVQLSLGFDGIIRPFFRGDMRQIADDQASGGDSAFVIEADDGGESIEDVTVRLSTRGMTPSIMVDVALAFIAQGGAVARVPPLPGRVIVKDPSVNAFLAATPQAAQIYTAVSIGKASDLITQAARIAGCRWWIRDDTLFFGKLGLPTTPQLATVLDTNSILGRPSIDGSGLIRVSAILNPNIVPGGQIALRDRVAPGSIENFRVEHGLYEGDTEGDTPWSVQVTGRRL